MGEDVQLKQSQATVTDKMISGLVDRVGLADKTYTSRPSVIYRRVSSS